MVESRRRAPKSEQVVQQTTPLGSILERPDFNVEQRRAAGIIRGLELSPEQQDLLFLYHLFHETGNTAQVKKFTGLKNSRDAFALIGKLMDSDELVKQYETFYTRYRLEDKEDE